MYRNEDEIYKSEDKMYKCEDKIPTGNETFELPTGLITTNVNLDSAVGLLPRI